ncbi:TPA: hypothetical protein ACXEZB_004394 [Escherichia coli]
MMLPNELIQNENDFKSAVSIHGKEVIKILLWIQKQKKEQVFAANAERKSDALWYEVRNLEKFINEIKDINEPTAPDQLV